MKETLPLPLRVFVGYDDREKVAFYTFIESLITNSSIPISITPLALSNLSGYRETHADGSNQFIYSRFLVPYLSGFEGYSLFFDGDMLIRSDIAELLQYVDSTKAVHVVQHDYKTKFPIKYLGAKNEDYPRKNWSSVVLFNNSHKANRALTPGFVETKSGSYLHRFSWLDDSEVGILPDEWNWLISEYDDIACKVAHFTVGTPCFDGYGNQHLADEWRQYRDEVLSHHES